jgi:hypothetical protein
VLGPRLAERTRKLLDVARLRRRLHITVRDLRSAVVFAVVGSRTCDEIVGLAESGQDEQLIGGRFYNAIFAGGEQDPFSDEAARGDRLLRLIGSLDVSRTAEPELDARLWGEDGASLFLRDPGTHRDIAYLTAERESARTADAADPPAHRHIRTIHAALRRLAYFEREDPGWISMLPYRSLNAFLDLMEDPTSEALTRMAQAISNSEGLYGADAAGSISVRLVSELEGSDRSFVTHPVDKFELTTVMPSSGLRYLEFAPDTVRLQHLERPDVRLDIDLDLFETLERVRSGFRPSREELRGAWLNLRVFKEQLGAMLTDSLLLSHGERRFYRIDRTGPESLHVVAVQR